ncbi:MAG: bacillithiol biosynthesis cysteine-adding enzyme BshC [Bacteroidota bacterium]|nr:bacillithiol biosynthesis cysteine-adding enzyme BshC [Bacteroidota bacterium]
MPQEPFSVKSLDPNSVFGFKSSDLAYWCNPKKFQEFIQNLPELAAIPDQIQHKKNTYKNRAVLSDILKRQYDSLPHELITASQLDKISSENCFTICCAHQPCLFTGPGYFIFKILSTIKWAQQINKAFPDYHFIPVYYCGSEDHDVEEINHVTIYNHALKWDSTIKGPVGRIPASGIEDVIAKIKDIFSREETAGDFDDFLASFQLEGMSYGWFTKRLIHHLFSEFGLLIFDPDDTDAKIAFKEVMKKEIEDFLIFKTSQRTIQKLKSFPFEIQANPREINLFYFSSIHSRERIILEGVEYKTTEGFHIANKTDISSFLDKNPEHFSPNVLLRPLYQESILPNIVFVGGGAEVSYWMQLKEVFDSQQISFPILARRCSGVIIDKSLNNKIQKFEFKAEEFLQEYSIVERLFINRVSHSKDEIQNQLQQIEIALKSISETGGQIETSLKNSLAADFSKLMKDIHHSLNKITKAEKLKYDVDLQKLANIYKQLYPDLVLQERQQSLITYYIRYGRQFLSLILENIHPEKPEVLLITQNSP